MSAASTASKEELLTACVAEQPARLARQQQADMAASDWNAVHAAVGSFADEYCTLQMPLQRGTLCWVCR